VDEMEDRLLRCYSAVFPGLSAEQIRTSSPEFLSAWDSLTAVTLAAVLEEEFGLQIDLTELPDLVSFEAVKNHIRTHDLST
jgi:acyl carrier protein